MVIGASAPTQHDQHATPQGSDQMSGPEVQANAIWTALHGLPLNSAPLWLDALLILLAHYVWVLRTDTAFEEAAAAAGEARFTGAGE